MRRRSVSVSVFLGVADEWDRAGVADAGVMGTGADGYAGGAYVDWLVNMLGHCGMIKGWSCWCVVRGGCMPAYSGSMGGWGA